MGLRGLRNFEIDLTGGDIEQACVEAADLNFDAAEFGGKYLGLDQSLIRTEWTGRFTVDWVRRSRAWLDGAEVLSVNGHDSAWCERGG